MRTDTTPAVSHGGPPEGSYSIVVLGEKDADDLAALEAACFSTAWTGERYRDILAAVDKALARKDAACSPPPPFMAYGLRERDGTLAAYISLGLHHAAGELEVYNIAVRADLRRKGYGSALLNAALCGAKRGRFCRALLEVRTGNKAALALYARTGFLECGRRKGYYADTGEDALVLCLELGSWPEYR